MKRNRELFAAIAGIILFAGCNLEEPPNGKSCQGGVSSYVLELGVTCRDYESCMELIQNEAYKDSKFVSALDGSALTAIKNGLCPAGTFECSGNVCKYIGMSVKCGSGTHSDPETRECKADSDLECGEHLDNCREKNQLCDSGTCSDTCSEGAYKCLKTEDPMISGICVLPETNFAFCGTKVDGDGKCYGYRTCLENQRCKDNECKCDPGYHLGLFSGKEACVEDTDTECTNREGEVQNCNELPNVKSAYCSVGFGCKIGDCLEGFHKDSTGDNCVENGSDKCGPEEIDCSAKDGWKSGRCEVNRCIAESCIDGYHVNNDECEVDNNDHCGSHDKQCNVAHAQNKCQNGECSFTCDAEYKPKGDKCVSSSAENCGSEGIDCADTVEGWVDGVCNGGICQATECDEQHYVSGGNCISSLVTNCGEEGVDCTEMEGWKEGTCNRGVCQVTECDEQHYISERICTLSNNDNCGMAGKSCVVSNGDGTCVNNRCVIACDENYHLNSTSNGCTQNTVENCGVDGYNCSVEVENWVTGKCTSEGECHVINCQENYHSEITECVEDIDENCGNQREDCTSKANGNFSCIRGKCIAYSCDTKYHKSSDGTECNLNTDTACGSDNVDCTKTSYEYKKAECDKIHGVCLHKSCHQGYRLMGNYCLKDCFVYSLHYGTSYVSLFCCASERDMDQCDNYGCPSYNRISGGGWKGCEEATDLAAGYSISEYTNCLGNGTITSVDLFMFTNNYYGNYNIYCPPSLCEALKRSDYYYNQNPQQLMNELAMCYCKDCFF